MKSLSIALVLCTLIVCGSIFVLPAVNQWRAISLAEREEEAKERNVTVTLVLVQTKATGHGLRMEEPKEAGEER